MFSLKFRDFPEKKKIQILAGKFSKAMLQNSQRNFINLFKTVLKIKILEILKKTQEKFNL
jgi:translation initiation factor 2 beta subunit (eIF-2beta)/eIF-5